MSLMTPKALHFEKTRWTLLLTIFLALLIVASWFGQMTIMMWTWPATIVTTTENNLQRTIQGDTANSLSLALHNHPHWQIVYQTPVSRPKASLKSSMPLKSTPRKSPSTAPMSSKNMNSMTNPKAMTNTKTLTNMKAMANMKMPSPLQTKAPQLFAHWVAPLPLHSVSLSQALARVKATHQVVTANSRTTVRDYVPIIQKGHLIAIVSATASLAPAIIAANTNNIFLVRYTLFEGLTVLALMVIMYIVINRWVIRPIRYQAQHDLMTTLYNQMTFWELFRDIARVAQTHNKDLSMLMFDMDNFKHVNDTYGHQQGDDVLRMLAKTIMKNIRKSDLPGRVGGEEFAIVLYDVPLDQAVIIANRIREQIALHKIEETQLGVSIGVSHAPSLDTYNVDALAKSADDALYYAKAHGKNQVCVAQGSPTVTDSPMSDMPT